MFQFLPSLFPTISNFSCLSVVIYTLCDLQVAMVQVLSCLLRAQTQLARLTRSCIQPLILCPFLCSLNVLVLLLVTCVFKPRAYMRMVWQIKFKSVISIYSIKNIYFGEKRSIMYTQKINMLLVKRESKKGKNEDCVRNGADLPSTLWCVWICVRNFISWMLLVSPQNEWPGLHAWWVSFWL